MSDERWNGSVASVNWLAMIDERVAAGANSECAMVGELPMTIVTAIVSPSARPVDRVTAPKRPTRALGSTTRQSTCQRVAPRANAASTWSPGTAAITSREMATIVGSTMTKSTKPASNRPTPSWAPLNGPVLPVIEASAGSTTVRTQGATTKSAHSP